MNCANVSVVLEAFHSVGETGVKGQNVVVKHAVEEPKCCFAVFEDEVVVVFGSAGDNKS